MSLPDSVPSSISLRTKKIRVELEPSTYAKLKQYNLSRTPEENAAVILFTFLEHPLPDALKKRLNSAFYYLECALNDIENGYDLIR